jgi:predicted peptidase
MNINSMCLKRIAKGIIHIISLTSFCLMVPVMLTGCLGFREVAAKPEGSHPDSLTGNYWRAEYSRKSKLNYVVTFPAAYEENTSAYPLILFLHSQAERGDNISLLIDNEFRGSDLLAPVALKDKNFPFITISPLCPKHWGWPVIDWRVNRLLKDVTKRYRINTSEIYLTGVSMGGMGTWSLAMGYPHWFAAIAPISGGIMFPMTRMKPGSIRNTPVWAFHDRLDTTIPIRFEEGKVNRLIKAGGNVKYTITETGKHEIWTGIYSKPDLFNWFLKNEKSKPAGKR